MSEKTKLTDSGVVMDPSAAFNLYIGSSTNSNTRQHAHDAHAQQITRQQVALKKYKKCATASVTLAVLAFLVLAIAVLLEILVRLSVLESSPGIDTITYIAFGLAIMFFLLAAFVDCCTTNRFKRLKK
uniref:Uncharacterized protein LOC102808504 n=1 Tax=Saccoglossus kowalevskii TaxID=10224 RepID=A0ABM0MMT6_SACKO|nr:PREDICTED: uncharacterized protein LOC102808504 [Saccoglossus kowalevskii]